MGRGNVSWPLFWTEMALKLVGGDATVDECNDFLETLGEDAWVTAQTIETYNTTFLKGKTLCSKRGHLHRQLWMLQQTPDGREAIQELIESRLSQENLRILGARVSLSLDFSQKPPKVTWRLSRKKNTKRLQPRPKKKTR